MGTLEISDTSEGSMSIYIPTYIYIPNIIYIIFFFSPQILVTSVGRQKCLIL